MNDKLLRAAIYIRVSTAEQQIHGKSLQAQREFLENYAKEHNMVIAGIYADEGKTARKELKKRKAIHSLLNAVKRQEIDIILFWKMDRWFRSVSDFYKVQDVLDEHKVKWVAVAEPNMNMDTRDGRLNLNIVLSIGQNEVDTTSERIKFTNESIVNSGRTIFGSGNMPFGYTTKCTNGEKRVVKDEEKAEMVVDLFEFYLMRQNKSEVIKHMQDTYGIVFTRTMFDTMLASEFYIGKYRNNEKYCPAYLTPVEWGRVQEVKKRNIRAKKSDRVYVFAGLIKCPECGRKLCGSGISRKNRHGISKSYSYYRCNKHAIDHICNFKDKISQVKIENYLLNNLEYEFSEFKVRTMQANALKKRKPAKRSSDKIKREINNLNLMFQKERITFDYYDKEYMKLENELKELNSIVEEPQKDFGHIDDILNSDFIGVYEDLDMISRQSFWHNCIKEIVIDKNGGIERIDFF